MKNLFIDFLKESSDYKKLLTSIKESQSPILISGIIDENIGHIQYALNQHLNRQILLITYDEKKAAKIYEDIVNLGGDRVRIFPKRDFMLYQVEAYSKEEEIKRLNILSKLAYGENIIVILSIESIFDKLISKELFKSNSLEFTIGSSINIDKMVGTFIRAGYERIPMVEAQGQFSIRGGILDFFPPNEENPIRVEFFDEEVDSIRVFDPISQRSLKNKRTVQMIPAGEVIIEEKEKNSIVNNIRDDLEKNLREKKLKEENLLKLESKYENLVSNLLEDSYITNKDILIPFIKSDMFSSIIDYLKEDSLIYLDEPVRIDDKILNLEEDFKNKYSELYSLGELLYSHKNLYFEENYLKKAMENMNIIEGTSILTNFKDRDYKSIVSVTSKSTPSYHKKIDLFIEDLLHYKNGNYRIVVTSGTEDRGLRLLRIIEDKNIEATYSEELNKEIKPGQIVIVSGSLNGGVEYPKEKFIIINDRDIFGSSKKKSSNSKKKFKKKNLNFTDLKDGDYIVHENHGIGRYEGVEQLDIQGVKKDYLNIRYREGDRLYVPIDQMHLIQKYIGSDSIKPKVNKLSSAEWAKAKKRAKLAVEEMAEELLELYAEREELEGFSFSKDGSWQREFEDFFPYEETEGQIRSTIEIKKDMEDSKPMDRLLCGDVGYGKTEVALRAAFKAVLDGKQVAFLVPTTILAQQHYKTMLERFENFPVSISILSRFQSQRKQEEDIKKLRQGRIDIIVGTHRLLSKDIKFRDLGLLIIDEEQRFGVKHKERLKQLKKNIDVLTLTATPIPRTLHMSLSGIRDMSVLEEPPEERYPVQTYVVEYNNQIIRDAIIKEKSRGGQVYFVSNRVQTIDKVAYELKKLVPEANFAIAHGQMNEKVLENVMMRFYEKEFDVLVCTTIIETGLDIPNANTIIINDADNFGLSQLYQLRGRVGRANRIAYAYFTYPENKVLSEVAERRLLAIKEFTEFGSGFKIAMRDLEIRGAGNLLGSQQHGEIEAIGYDLYVKFLNEAVKKVKGESYQELADTIVDLKIDGYIPESYIKDEEQKVDIYKRIASLEDMSDYEELLDELIDRFGDIPKATINLMDISYIRSLGSRNNIKSIIQSKEDIVIDFQEEEKIPNDLIELLLEEYSYKIKFNFATTPGFRFKVRKDVLLEVRKLLEDIDSYRK